MDIKVLGTGCANCRTTIALIERVAQAKGVAIRLQKVEALRDIMGYGVMSTPGVVIDGKVVHDGGKALGIGPFSGEGPVDTVRNIRIVDPL